LPGDLLPGEGGTLKIVAVKWDSNCWAYIAQVAQANTEIGNADPGGYAHSSPRVRESSLNSTSRDASACRDAL
jgi:hypothetical protein